jgi:hypothetical protein
MPPTNRKRRTTAAAAATPAEQDKYAPNVWLNNGLGAVEDVILPSGQLVMLRRPGVEGLAKAGVLNNLDSLSALISEKHVQRVNGKQQVNMQTLLSDDDNMAQVQHVVDRVACYCVVKPEVKMTPNDVTRREPGVVYADMVDLLDKMFILNYVVGGTRDLESFRGELKHVLGGVAAEPAVQGAAQ